MSTVYYPCAKCGDEIGSAHPIEWSAAKPYHSECTPTFKPRRYWSANGFSIAIVVLPGIVDWAAYIGATMGTVREEETVEFVAARGCKLEESLARTLFPQFSETSYRA
ncbi:hypothetical protein LCGC14_1312470 [marine sediment metagenome]|uniref:Uncharacterized protein n=1 Tax=marine sediment metagenome TaxID=412755 RepID=A0A0F9KLT9_9ZZZZ